MASNNPIVVAFPPFRGVTKRLIVATLVVTLGILLVSAMLHGMALLLINLINLTPDQVVHKQVWQLVTYPFLGGGLLSLALVLLSLWFFGSMMENERGSRWFTEYFVVTTVGGGIIACALAYAVNGRIPQIDPNESAAGLWPFFLALLLAYARYHAEEELSFNFLFRIKAKYLAAIYLLFYLASSLIGSQRFAAVLALSNALAGWLFLQFAPRQGLRAGASEGWFGVRNAYGRYKRRRAARKFTVYMRKQGKEVSLDEEGRYIDPNGTPRDLNDRKWMN